MAQTVRIEYEGAMKALRVRPRTIMMKMTICSDPFHASYLNEKDPWFRRKYADVAMPEGMSAAMLNLVESLIEERFGEGQP
jgi:hypothetical protein